MTTRLAQEDELHPDIARALDDTFDTASPKAMTLLQGGLSDANVYRVQIGGRSYVLRHRIGAEAGAAVAQGAAERELTCMHIAAEQGIAPRVLYANAASGVSISDFVEGKTLGEELRSDPSRARDLLAPLGHLLRALHRAPAFPSFTTVADACLAVGGALQAHGVALPHGDAFFERIAETRAALAPHIALAPCHHDLNPGNIIVDGNKRLWIIDWGGACAGDPMHDVVTPSVFVYRTPEAHGMWLRTYFDREPTEIETARALVARVQAQTFFSLLLLASTARQSPHTVNAAAFGAELANIAEREAATAEYASALRALA